VIGEHLKAIVGSIVAFAIALGTALTVGDMNLGDLDARAWLNVVLATLGSGAFIWLVENSGAAPVAKAVTAAATSGIGALLLAMDEESAGGKVVTQAEWLGVFVTAAIATGVVYQVRNERADKRVEPAPVR
jgi:hypothetical protein